MPPIERVLYSADEIQAKVTELGQQIARDYQGQTLHLVGVLRGALPFLVGGIAHGDNDGKAVVHLLANAVLRFRVMTIWAAGRLPSMR